jgi:hypothetical protein
MMQCRHVSSSGRFALLILVPALLSLSGCWLSAIEGPDQAPSVALIPAAGQLNLYNKGDLDLQLWGDKVAGSPPEIDEQARIIARDEFYSFPIDRLKAVMPPATGHDREKLISFEVYLSDMSGRNYIAKFDLLVKITSGNMTIHTQQLGLRLANGFKDSATSG